VVRYIYPTNILKVGVERVSRAFTATSNCHLPSSHATKDLKRSTNEVLHFFSETINLKGWFVVGQPDKVVVRTLRVESVLGFL
jgi:hypothetical protein